MYYSRERLYRKPIMRKFVYNIYSIGVLLLIITAIFLLIRITIYRFTHITLTETQLFIECQNDIGSLVVCVVLASVMHIVKYSIKEE